VSLYNGFELIEKGGEEVVDESVNPGVGGQSGAEGGGVVGMDGKDIFKHFTYN